MCVLLLSLVLGLCNGYGLDVDTASRLQPFYGQNAAPSGNTDVHITVGLQKITNLDDTNYQFEGIFR